MKTQVQRQDELWIMESFVKSGYNAVLCHPDPPDLIVNGIIGVEVRRLNQHYFFNGGYESVENANQSFRRLCQEVINEFPNPDHLPSGMISYVMHRPLLPAKDNKKQIRETLAKHLPFINSSRKYVLKRIDISIQPWFQPMENRYFIGAIHDGNRGGFVQDMAMENFPIALNAKEQDLPRYQTLYSECWLALIDEMYLWHDEFSLVEMVKSLQIQTNFDKIILFSPFKHFAFTTLHPNNKNLEENS